MFLDKRQIELIKKSIEDFNFIKEEIENKIKNGYNLEEISTFLNRFKDIEITSLDCINGDSWLDFLYKDISACVCDTKEKGLYVGSTFEIYDKKNYEYIVEDLLTVKEYENLINTPKEEMIADAIHNLKYYESQKYTDLYNRQRDRLISFLKEEY